MENYPERNRDGGGLCPASSVWPDLQKEKSSCVGGFPDGKTSWDATSSTVADTAVTETVMFCRLIVS